MTEKSPLDTASNLPEHESAVRRVISDARKRPYLPLRSFQEARSYPDGVVIFEGDWGGQIYATCPAAAIDCDDEARERLLRDFDALGWGDLSGARIYYERRSVGARVSGGMGGGKIIEGVWLHERLAQLGLTAITQDILAGRCDAQASIYYAVPPWEEVIVDGFTFGNIDAFESGTQALGNGFVIGPDGSRAGIRWHTLEKLEDLSERDRSSPDHVQFATQPDYFEERRAPESHMWGIWEVAFPHPMHINDPLMVRQDARHNLASVVPFLHSRWSAWVANRA